LVEVLIDTDFIVISHKNVNYHDPFMSVCFP
jgi:hypothetical protein